MFGFFESWAYDSASRTIARRTTNRPRAVELSRFRENGVHLRSHFRFFFSLAGAFSL